MGRPPGVLSAGWRRTGGQVRSPEGLGVQMWIRQSDSAISIAP
ncbi:hypothetical protein CLV63_103350 [Murinocardiopsis flavida]|uniref:Uncharacterized protein n=1 Tax=Murinocardiopsis flavida TaxID=645275 RepID=A0A2P8DQY4_9ACTN|nr:hypothetical protein CLV63_103350 [Murinocardiopsis flavida]